MLSRFRNRLQDAVATETTRRRSARLLPLLYHQMHEQDQFCGVEWERHLGALEQNIPNLKERRILDFGCGPKGGLQSHYRNAIGYDPYVPRYASPPWEESFTVVFSCDVLEHLTQADLEDFAFQLLWKKPQFIYLAVSTRRAHLKLPNGANTHLTVRRPAWWRRYFHRRLGGQYQTVLDQTDFQRKEWRTLLIHEELAA